LEASDLSERPIRGEELISYRRYKYTERVDIAFVDRRGDNRFFFCPTSIFAFLE